jgi:hypothetical protein
MTAPLVLCLEHLLVVAVIILPFSDSILSDHLCITILELVFWQRLTLDLVSQILMLRKDELRDGLLIKRQKVQAFRLTWRG